MQMRISVIIPTFNEEKKIQRTLTNIVEGAKILPKDYSCQIIVVDGNSQDATVIMAKKYTKHVFCIEPGRAKQLNFGAKKSTGDVLFFLHADTILAQDALLRIIYSIEIKNTLGGTFKKKWAWPPDITLSPFAKLLNKGFRGFGNWLIRLFRVFPGDNGFFIQREIFFRLRGYKQMWICEDLDLAYRFRDYVGEQIKDKENSSFGSSLRKKIDVIQSYVQTSPRRFQKYGIFRMWTWWTQVFCRWRLGWSQRRLKDKFTNYERVAENSRRKYIKY